MIISFHDLVHVGLDDVPAAWRTLIRDISANSPAIGMVGDLNLINSLIECRVLGEEMLLALKEEAPMLYNVLREDTQHLEVLRPMLTHLREKVNYVLSFTEHTLTPGEADHLCHFPNMPQLVHRGKYFNDKDKKMDICTKKAPRHQTLTPGIFTLSCEHGMFEQISFFSHLF